MQLFNQNQENIKFILFSFSTNLLDPPIDHPPDLFLQLIYFWFFFQISTNFSQQETPLFGPYIS